MISEARTFKSHNWKGTFMNDITAWTLNNAIQSHINVYVSQETFTEVKRSFPYLVAKEFASGGGDVTRLYIYRRFRR
jgi:hypothetical protein